MAWVLVTAPAVGSVDVWTSRFEICTVRLTLLPDWEQAVMIWGMTRGPGPALAMVARLMTLPLPAIEPEANAVCVPVFVPVPVPVLYQPKITAGP